MFCVIFYSLINKYIIINKVLKTLKFQYFQDLKRKLLKNIKILDKILEYISNFLSSVK